MLEGLLAEFLGHLLGDFVEDIDEKQLRIAIMQGTLDLCGLYVRPDAISRFGFPLRVKRGRIGSLRLSVPWSNIKSEATSLVIKDVFILLEPCAWQADDYVQRQQSAKMLAVYRALRPIKAKLEAKRADDSSWTDALLQSVLDNLQATHTHMYVEREKVLANCSHTHT